MPEDCQILLASQKPIWNPIHKDEYEDLKLNHYQPDFQDGSLDYPFIWQNEQLQNYLYGEGESNQPSKRRNEAKGSVEKGKVEKTKSSTVSKSTGTKTVLMPATLFPPKHNKP